MDKLNGWSDRIKYNYADDMETKSEKKRIERIYDVAKELFAYRRFISAEDAIDNAENFVDTFTKKFGDVW